jgi:hypothetical protein
MASLKDLSTEDGSKRESDADDRCNIQFGLNPVCSVCLVRLVCLVYSVGLVGLVDLACLISLARPV